MKVSEAIAKADALRLNTMGDEIKAEWLRELDGQLLEMVRNGEARPASPAEDAEPPEKIWPEANVWPEEDSVLLLPFPHEMVYVYYLVAQIDYHNEEGERYANDMAVYNTAMSEARAWWRRNHRGAYRGNWRVM